MPATPDPPSHSAEYEFLEARPLLLYTDDIDASVGAGEGSVTDAGVPAAPSAGTSSVLRGRGELPADAWAAPAGRPAAYPGEPRDMPLVPAALLPASADPSCEGKGDSVCRNHVNTHRRISHESPSGEGPCEVRDTQQIPPTLTKSPP